MSYRLKDLKRLAQYARLLSSDATEKFHVSFISDEKFLHFAKKLHADVYLERNFITADQINDKGYLAEEHDPYQNHADYFSVSIVNGEQLEIIATARQIKISGEKGHNSFPTISNLELYPDMKERLTTINPEKCVEISALAKRRGESSFAVLMLYRQMWQHSLREGHQLWLMACDVAVYSQLKLLFGEAFIEIGPKAFYMGSWVVPAALEVESSLYAITKKRTLQNPVQRSIKKALAVFFRRGLSQEYLDAKKPLYSLSLLLQKER